MQHGPVRNLERVSNRSRRFKWVFPNDAQNGGVNLIEGRPSDAMLVMEAFPSSADLPDLGLNSSQSRGPPSEVRLKFYENLVCIKALIGEKFDDNPLFQFHREDCPTYSIGPSTFVSGVPRRGNIVAACKHREGGLDRPGFSVLRIGRE